MPLDLSDLPLIALLIIPGTINPAMDAVNAVICGMTCPDKRNRPTVRTIDKPHSVNPPLPAEVPSLVSVPPNCFRQSPVGSTGCAGFAGSAPFPVIATRAPRTNSFTAPVAQIALEFGANDFGSTMIEENVVAATGVGFRLSREEIVRQITDAGYEPRQRDHVYNLIG